MTIVSERQKVSVRTAVYRAIQEGWLVRLPCVVCGREPAEAHHDDYDKPLEVVWLCRIHHSWVHKYGDTVPGMIAQRAIDFAIEHSEENVLR